MPAKKTAKSDSRFFVVNTLNETRGRIESTVKSYNKKLIGKKLETGREFLNEFKADPMKKIDDVIDDSKDAINEAKTTRINALRRKVDSTRKNIQGRFDKANQETRRLYKGVGNDAKLVMEDVIDMGKKTIDKIPMKQTIEKKFNTAIDAIPAKFNLPSKSEIDNLVSDIDGVNKKVDELNKRYVKA